MRVQPPSISRLLRAYHLGPDHPMKIRLWTLLRRATGYPRLTIPYAGSGWISLDERDYLQREIYVHGAYEPEVWKALAAQLEPSDLLWDVGAHVGAVSVRALLDPRVRACHAFEPDPVQAEALAINLALNGNHGILHHIALSDRSETRMLYHGPRTNIGLSSLAESTTDSVFSVPCRSGDELVFDDGMSAPDLLKIDVEGWELRVLQGMERMLRERPPRAIVFEWAVDEAGIPHDNAPVTYLGGFGYQVQRIIRPDQHIEARENFIALRRA